MIKKATSTIKTISADTLNNSFNQNYNRLTEEVVWELENKKYNVILRKPSVAQYSDFITFQLINILPLVELPIKVASLNKELNELNAYDDKVQACLQTFANMLGNDNSAELGKSLSMVFSNSQGCDYLYRALSETFINIDIRNCETDLFLLCVIKFISYLSDVFNN